MTAAVKALFAVLVALLAPAAALAQNPPTSANTLTVVQPTGTNLHAVIDSGTITTSPPANASTNVSQVGGSTVQSATNGLNTTGGGLQSSAGACQRDDTSPQTITENQFGNVRCSQNGDVNMRIMDAASNNRGANVNSSNQLSVSVDNSNVSTNIAQMNGVAVTMGNGASGTGVQRVTIASDSTGQVALAAGSNTIGAVSQVPTTSGGLSSCYLSSAASTNATNCKSSAGQIYGFQVINTTSTIYYLRLYNASSTPTCSSATNYIRSLPIPHGNGAGAGIATSMDNGEAFSTGIAFCFTGGGSSTDNTNAATGVYITILYK